MHVVLTNDDGIQAFGLRSFYHALISSGYRVTVIAPVTEQSAVGHALTVYNPLRLKYFDEQSFKGFGIYGTPSDCMKLGLIELLKNDKPDIVVSGINSGANVGPDILYSGTVAAATEAAHLGFPAVAVSFDSYNFFDVKQHANYAVNVINNIDTENFPDRLVLNLNLPNIPANEIKGLAVCPQTTALWADVYKERHDPRGNSYWWMEGHMPKDQVEEHSDRAMLWAGYATLTPLKFDFTNREAMSLCEELKEKIKQ
ncbi:5'/3'-nucleotidase SurE [Desulfovibrio litoralis]|uniref:5'/3'-nucleotidase SurE n=1 Tax=Desulfovibrio litoralis TaxID=466107 RepID=UPI0009351491|nr:5'/3'-nucleotidase SurE [Desulfovibrio litoralis]